MLPLIPFMASMLSALSKTAEYLSRQTTPYTTPFCLKDSEEVLEQEYYKTLMVNLLIPIPSAIRHNRIDIICVY